MQNSVFIGIGAIILLLGGFWMYNNKNDMPKDTMAKNEPQTVTQKEVAKPAMPAQEAGVMVGGAMMLPSLDIVENAVQAKNVTTVVAAVSAAGLVDTLKSAGPFTVFAPNNAAFEKLPAGTVATLLKPENKAKLAAVLTYHVVAGRYTTADLKNGQVLKTVNGQNLTITKEGNKILINGSAMVETADVISKNGITFVIDSVLLPK